MYNLMTIVNCMVYLKVAKRVHPKSSHKKIKFFFGLKFSLIEF